jgi:hypothetical protein
MNFWIGGRCQPIRHGNPTVNLDPRFLDHDDLHVLDLSDTSTTTVIPINVEQTLGGDWLLQTDVQERGVCATFPSPYDNDYRGGDPINVSTHFKLGFLTCLSGVRTCFTNICLAE